MLEPTDWTVVVVGRWNRSILTPEGIGRRLFKVPPETPLEIELAIDVMLPPRVTYNGLRVAVSSQRLIIESLGCNFAELERGRDLARNALSNLGETPVSAAGVNVKYIYKEPDDHLTRIFELMNCELDDRLAPIGDRVIKRTLSRSMPVGAGNLNLTLLEDEQSQLLVHLNYECISEDLTTLNQWLQWPIGECEQNVKASLSNALEVPEDLIKNG